MKQVAEWALNIANQRGASYADARIVDSRSRALATKNGKVGQASESESLGMGIRVLGDGAWGFAASDDLSRSAVEETAVRWLAPKGSLPENTHRPEQPECRLHSSSSR